MDSSFKRILSNCSKRLNDLGYEEKRLRLKLQSILNDKKVVDESLLVLKSSIEENHQKFSNLYKALSTECTLTQQYESSQCYILNFPALVERTKKRNDNELKELIDIFERLVAEFKEAEENEKRQCAESISEKVNCLKDEISKAEQLVEVEEEMMKKRRDHLNKSFFSKIAEKERMLRIKQAEFEVIVDQIESENKLREEMLAMKLATEAEKKQKELQDLCKPQEEHNPTPAKKPKSPTAGPYLSKSSATAESRQENGGRRKLPVSVSFQLDDEDMF